MLRLSGGIEGMLRCCDIQTNTKRVAGHARQGKRSTKVVSRVVMAGSFGLPLLPVPKSTLREQLQPCGSSGGQPLAAPSQSSSKRSGPPRDPHPAILCGAAPVGAVIVITASARYLTPRHVTAAKQRTCLADHDIGPTNDTRRGVRRAVPERRLLLASVVWEQSLDKRPLAFWHSGTRWDSG